MKRGFTRRVPEIAALLSAGVDYWLTIYPRARREIRRCRRRACQIPDPTLRAHAVGKLTRERLNPEAAAFFAVLAPRRRRRTLVRLLVDFQIAYDYLDAVNEEPAAACVRNGMQLHRALRDAVSSQPFLCDYYRYSPRGDDGDYLLWLVRDCRAALGRLPSAAALEPILMRAADRVGEGQSRNHALLVEGERQLIEWAEAEDDGRGYLWWELAAAGISCLALHALFAAAACRTAPIEAVRIDSAYFPSVCAISALLDSLIDHPYDGAAENHSFVAHYPSPTLVADRLAAITREARALSRSLRRQHRHRVILAGIASFYLSAPEACTRFARPAAARTLAYLAPTSVPILAVMRARRRRAR